MPLDDETEARLDAQLRAIVDGIERGLFPCIVVEPGSWTPTWRSYTDPDVRGTRDRWRDWMRKRGAPELAPLRVMIDGEDPGDGDGDGASQHPGRDR